MTQGKDLNNLVALFLAEAIRSRRTSLSRVAEISQRVVSNLKNLNSESRALAVLTEIEKDFREITSLRQALHFGYHPSDVKVYEQEIKDYAAKLFSKDMKQSAEFLQQAAQPGVKIQELCIKYPGFSDHLFYYSADKSKLAQAL